MMPRPRLGRFKCSDDDAAPTRPSEADDPPAPSKPLMPMLTPRELLKLKKKKQNGTLTAEEMAKYGHLLETAQSISGKVTAQSQSLNAVQNTFNLENLNLEGCGGGLSDFREANKPGGAQTSKDIRFESVSIVYQGKTLIHSAAVRLLHRQKYGFIGQNGSGKSTLLRHLSTRELPVSDNISLLHVEQEADPTDDSALNFVLMSDKKRLDLLARQTDLKDSLARLTWDGRKEDEDDPEAAPGSSVDAIEALSAELAELEAELRYISAYTAETRAASILSGLQFTDAMQKKAVREFSGGWRMRLALARALFLTPDLLILDEPSNHLDLNAVIWLQAYLRKWKNTLLVVSHDRDFINYFVTDVILLEDNQLHYFHGDIDAFEHTRMINEKTKKKITRASLKLADQMQKHQTTSTRGGASAVVRKKLSKSISSSAATISATAPGDNYIKDLMPKTKAIKFRFGDPKPVDDTLLRLIDVSFSYPAKDTAGCVPQSIFCNVDFQLDMGTRIAILGPNGVGKSTFIKLALGEIRPTAGEVVRHRKLVVANYSQHFIDQLNPAENAVSYISKRFPDLSTHQIRTYLGSFGLTGNAHINPIALLSGGQKARVVFTSISLLDPHIIFLDEPTNHLDMDAIQALVDGLSAFPGGLVLVTHDQRLVKHVCNELWHIQNDGSRTVKRYPHNFDRYRQDIIDTLDDELFESDEDAKVK